jgi:predicted Rdx family selenoprotein
MAAGLAAAIESSFGMTAELVEGHDGIYEVTLDGELVYSNQKGDYGFPIPQRIVDRLGVAMGVEGST